MTGFALGFVSVYLYTRLRISYLFHIAEQKLNRGSGVNAALTPEKSRTLTSIAEQANLRESSSLTVMASGAKTSVRDALSVMTQLLYDVQGKGFHQAIEMGTQLIQTPAVSVPRFWFLMAAAHGQNYADQKNTGATSSSLAKIREDILYSIDKTLELDPRYKTALRNMLDEANPDNDLKSFANDPDFILRLK